jgi:acetyl esterase/lipase
MLTITGTLTNAATAPAPEIECWLPEKNTKGLGIVVFPGGGYGDLSSHEGRGYAAHFNRAGIACFVVKYRLGSAGHRHPQMLEDALAAIYTIKSRAAEFTIHPQKVGLMGSSAGGHLAAHTLVSWQNHQSPIHLRPAFGILCYPVITASGPYAHQGSIRNLAGESPPPALLKALSCNLHVSTMTPPCFLWHTAEDTVVPMENSLLFAAALRRHTIPFELHLYNEGRHGLGLNTPFDWASTCIRWLEQTVPC